MNTATKSMLSQILKRLLFEKDLTATELARTLGMPQPTLHRIVEGITESPHMPTLIQLAKYFGLTVAQLKGEAPIEWLAAVDLSTSNSGWKRIPLIEWSDLHNMQHVQELDLMRPVVMSNAEIVGKGFALKMMDASMAPEFPLGSTLIFDEGRQPADRCYALIYIYEEQRYTFRQLLIDGPHRFMRPLSPDLKHLPYQTVSSKDVIVGVLTQAIIQL